MNLVRVVKALFFRIPVTAYRRCNICNHRVKHFLPYRKGMKSAPPLIQVLDVIGSDLDNCECPWCGAHDRERHLYMYMDACGILNEIGDMRILHFAPEIRLSRIIASYKPNHYIKCDLYPAKSDIKKIDIHDIPYPEKFFDLVVANHVLEHVANDLLALKEVRRVLKPAGRAILQTPFSPKLHKTWHDEGINDDMSRLQAFGQEDHVRLFGKDIFARIASAGLQPRVVFHEDVLRRKDSWIYGVNIREPFFMFERPDSG